MKNIFYTTILALSLFIAAVTNHVYAFDSFNWMDTGYEVKTLTNNLQKIGSLSGWHIQLDDQHIPTLKTRTFINYEREDLGHTYTNYRYREPFPLGNIRPSDANYFTSAPTSTNDWVYHSFNHTYGSNQQFSLTTSRITPALLVTYNAEGLRVFDGLKNTLESPTVSWGNFPALDHVGNPKYFAYPTASGIKAVASPNQIDLSDMTDHWILMWYGDGSYLWGTNDVLYPNRGDYSGIQDNFIFDPSHWLYKIDIPTMLAFDVKPTSITIDTTHGGVELNYPGNSSTKHAVIQPLFGEKHLAVVSDNATDPNDVTQTTANWHPSLPNQISQLAQATYLRMGQYPLTVKETYNLDSNDNLSIKNTFDYLDLGFGQHFAYISPALSLAQDGGINISFESTPVIETNALLNIGPLRGIDQNHLTQESSNQYSYQYTISDLSLFAKIKRIKNNSNSAPTWIRQELDNQLKDDNTTGDIYNDHLAPWWPVLSKFDYSYPEQAAWAFPWETQFYLGNAIDVASNPQSLKTYLQSEFSQYPPALYNRTHTWLNHVKTIPYDVGTRRESYRLDDTIMPNYSQNPHHRLNISHLLGVYALAEYYTNIGDINDLYSAGAHTQRWTDIKNIFKPYMQNSDWSTFAASPHEYNLGLHAGQLKGGIGEANNLAAAAIGLVRLADLVNDAEARSVGLYLLNKALASRLAQEKLTQYLHTNNLQRTPPESNWLATNSRDGGENGDANLWQRDWSSPIDDTRRPIRYDQFGLILGDYYPNSFTVRELAANMNLTPEVGQFLRMYALPEISEWVEVNEANSPTWYVAYSESYIGKENHLNTPYNSHQIFTVKAWVMQEPAEQLTKYIDMPWVQFGDYYYITKLAETIKAYDGWCWSQDGQICIDNNPIPTSAPSPTNTPSQPGDIDYDTDVDIFDYNLLLKDFGVINNPTTEADLDDDDDVDIFDYNLLVQYFGL